MSIRAAARLAAHNGLVAVAAVLTTWACWVVDLAERVAPESVQREPDRINIVVVDGEHIRALPTRSGRVHAQREAEA